MDVARFLEKNTALLKLGLTIKGGGARQRIGTYLLRNNDAGRVYTISTLVCLTWFSCCSTSETASE